MRYLLYDVKLGEGFNLQKEVFIRAGALLEKLPGNWTLVLPPWCWLAHWNVDPRTSNKPWGDFFSLEFMKRKGIPVLEYSAYKMKVKGEGVDHTIFLDHWAMENYKPDAREVPCAEMSSDAQLQSAFIDESGGKYTHGKIAYSGMCGHIPSKKVQCIQQWGKESVYVAELIGKLERQNARSILVKKLDHTSGPMDVPTYWKYRDALIFSDKVRLEGEKIIKKLGRPYLAAHIRRDDFPQHAHPGTTPDVENAVTQLNDWAKKIGAKSVFIATDGTDKEVKQLTSKVKNLHVLRGKDADFDHPGLNAVIEQWVTIQADNFVGTQVSRFTQSIQEDRDLLGHPQDTTWHHFCGNKATDKACEGGYKENWFKPFPPSKQRQAFLAERNAIMPPTVLPGTIKPNPVWSTDGGGGFIHKEPDEL